MNQKQTLLFICIENACRSQIAEALIDMKYPNYIQAESAGSQPATTINPKTKQWLTDNGLSPDQYTPKSVSDLFKNHYDYVISMGCGDDCPYVKAKEHLEWNIPDPKDVDYEEFLEIVQKIDSHIEQLFAKTIRT